jgi:O-acetylhomoserine (thiol)-lyase
MKKDRPRPTESFGFGTRTIHAGAGPDPLTGARNVPIYQTTSYVFDDVDHAASLFNLQTFGYIYTRIGNPTVSALEEKIANLEGGRGATCCSSGHAAQLLAFFSLLQPGDEFVASKRLYGGSITQFTRTFKKLGWTAHMVDPDDPENFRRAITPRTKLLFIEALANPGGVVCDVEPIAAIAHAAGIPLVVDNTLATPYLGRRLHPFDDQVSLRARGRDGRRRRRVGPVRLGARRQVPLAHRARVRLSWDYLLRNLR